MEKEPLRQFSIVQALYLSFYSRPFYRDVAANWKGLCVGYLLIILSLFWIAETARLQRELADFIDEKAPRYITQVPRITIARGEVSIEEPVPYVIRDPDTGAPFAVIDTSGSTQTLDGSEAMILLTKTEVMVRRSGTDTPVLRLSEDDNYVIDRQTLYSWAKTAGDFFILLLFPFLLFFSFLIQFLQILIAAAMGMLFARRHALSLAYRQLVRLAAVAFTPAVLLQTAHAILDIPFPYRLPLSFLISIGYLYYGVTSTAESGPRVPSGAA